MNSYYNVNELNNNNINVWTALKKPLRVVYIERKQLSTTILYFIIF